MPWRALAACLSKQWLTCTGSSVLLIVQLHTGQVDRPGFSALLLLVFCLLRADACVQGLDICGVVIAGPLLGRYCS